MINNLYKVLIEQKSFTPIVEKDYIPTIEELIYKKHDFKFKKFKTNKLTEFNSLLFSNLKLKVTTNETNYILEHLLSEQNIFSGYLPTNERENRVTRVTFHLKF